MAKHTAHSNFFHAIVSLYYLLIHADGSIHHNEIEVGTLMRALEGINDDQFEAYLSTLRGQDQKAIYERCLQALRSCKKTEQIRIIAWMSKIANADGNLDPAEWALFYQIYFRELGIQLGEILKVQKQLSSETER